MLTIIIPSCTDALVTKLLTTLRVSSPEPTYQVIVADNGLSTATRQKYPDILFVEVPEPFCFSKAINLAAAHAAPGNNLLLINDDVVIQSERFVEGIERAVVKAKAEGFGIISPITAGGVGNRDQAWDVPPGEIWLTRETLCFVCVALPRAVWDEIGGLDEDYVFYGFDDVQACRQVVDAGWKLGVTGAAKIKHGNVATPHSNTYKKKFNPKELSAISTKARDVFHAKWGTGPRLGAYEQGGPAVDRVIVDQDQVPTQRFVVDSHKALGQEIGQQPEPFTSRAVAPPPASFGLAGLEPWDLTRERLVELAGPVPDHIFELGQDTDIESDVDLVWAITKLLKPQVTVELGTRHGIATRVIADALIDMPNTKLYTIDPQPKYRDSVADVKCQFLLTKGEEFLAGMVRTAVPAKHINLCLIDLDPHPRIQTTGLLSLLEKVLAPGGCALFHDIVQNRPEIQVKEAVREFVATRSRWRWVEFPLREAQYKWAQGGLGLLIRPS